MGTRSLTLFFKKGGKTPFVCMYRQFDGYLNGHGKDLAKFLLQRKRVNGIGDETAEDAANGIGCLAAQCVAYFKTGRYYDDQTPVGGKVGNIRIGDIYLQEYTPDGWQEYEYEVRADNAETPTGEPPKDAGWVLTAYSFLSIGRKKLFEGTPQEFLEKLEKDKLVED